jgi:GTPase SAR1 family protein
VTYSEKTIRWKQHINDFQKLKENNMTLFKTMTITEGDQEKAGPPKNPILITGPAASGKTTLLDGLGGSVNAKTYDLDRCGYVVGGKQWIVDTGCVKVLAKRVLLFSGCCDNMDELIDHMSPAGIYVLVPDASVLLERSVAREKETGHKNFYRDLTDAEETVEHWLAEATRLSAVTGNDVSDFMSDSNFSKRYDIADEYNKNNKWS